MNDKPTVEIIYEKMFSKKLHPDSHKEWAWLSTFGGACEGRTIRETIAVELKKGRKVKSGYTTTSVRGYHENWILTKD